MDGVRFSEIFAQMVSPQRQRALCALMGSTLTRAQRRHVLARYFEEVTATALLPERRARSCPRVVRQPVTKWPRKIDQPSHTGEVTIELMQD